MLDYLITETGRLWWSRPQLMGTRLTSINPQTKLQTHNSPGCNSKLRNVATTESFHFVFSGAEATFHKLASKYRVILDTFRYCKYPGCVNQKNNSWLKPVMLIWIPLRTEELVNYSNQMDMSTISRDPNSRSCIPPGEKKQDFYLNETSKMHSLASCGISCWSSSQSCWNSLNSSKVGGFPGRGMKNMSNCANLSLGILRGWAGGHSKTG